MEEVYICGIAEIGNKQQRQQKKQQRKDNRQQRRQDKRGGPAPAPGSEPMEQDTPTPSPAPPPKPGGQAAKLTLPPAATLPGGAARRSEPVMKAQVIPQDKRVMTTQAIEVARQPIQDRLLERQPTEGKPGTAERTGQGGIGEMLSNPLVLGGLVLAAFLIFKPKN